MLYKTAANNIKNNQPQSVKQFNNSVNNTNQNTNQPQSVKQFDAASLNTKRQLAVQNHSANTGSSPVPYALGGLGLGTVGGVLYGLTKGHSLSRALMYGVRNGAPIGAALGAAGYLLS